MLKKFLEKINELECTLVIFHLNILQVNSIQQLNNIIAQNKFEEQKMKEFVVVIHEPKFHSNKHLSIRFLTPIDYFDGTVTLKQDGSMEKPL
uniref:Uncharacterized protein n=1 Tax=Onchocerca volvulus TaxID=6282 RepID=A0A8R1TMW7_ONCVO